MKRVNKLKKSKPKPTNCPFCSKGLNPDYKDTETLSKYLTERGKIIGKAKTGVCAKHQRRIDEAIKQARYLGLLPFIVRPH